jgi:hypothetical protein
VACVYTPAASADVPISLAPPSDHSRTRLSDLVHPPASVLLVFHLGPSEGSVWHKGYYLAVLTNDFERLFRRLVGAFLHYLDVPRTPDNVAELGASRWDLELAREAIALARGRIKTQPSSPPVSPRHTAISADDVALLRVLGDGLTGR